MAAEIFAGAAVGTLMNAAYDGVLRSSAARSVFSLAKICTKLEEELKLYEPIFNAAFRSVESRLLRSSEDRAPTDLDLAVLDFKRKLDEGTELLRRCKGLAFFDLVHRYRSGKEILRFVDDIRKFHRANWASIAQIAQIQEQLSLSIKYAAEDEMWRVKIDEHMREINGWMLSSQSTMSSPRDPCCLNTPPLPNFVVGLEDRVRDLRSMLLWTNYPEEARVVAIVGGMGGIGKTTLAQAICKDEQVGDFFQHQIHFVTVSQSPDMIALFSTIWTKVTGEKDVPRFQNCEDAQKQLQSKLEHRMRASSSSRCLLVLDDVWSKPVLEKLRFDNIPRVWTLVTTRNLGLLHTTEFQTYRLDILSKENAHRLFCFWTFRQIDIPSWADKNLVEEVIWECHGLPLALKVISASLSSHSRDPLLWHRALKDLRQVEMHNPNHQSELFDPLRRSVEALDPNLRDCFIDLGAFPEDTWSPVNNLLDIWVYVRGMAFEDAYITLIDLASRCLLDLEKNIDRHVNILNSSADPEQYVYDTIRSWKFKQHDVLRDLAIHMSSAKLVHERRWLLMPQPQDHIPMQWQSERPMLAQVVSISTTDRFNTNNWPYLEFPHAEALLWYNNSYDCEPPPFIRSMTKLKVLVIIMRPSGRISKADVLEGVHSLQSFYLDAGDYECFIDISREQMPKLKKMMVRGRIKGSYGDMILNNLGLSSSSLEILSLENDRYKEEILMTQSCDNLKLLDIREFKLLRVLEISGSFSMLRYINIWNCASLEELVLPTETMKNLEVLQIVTSGKELFRLQELPSNLGNLVALQKLVVSPSVVLYKLPDTIGKLQCLKELHLGSASMLKTLPKSLVELTKLETLELLGCEHLNHLPDDIGKLQCLKILQVMCAYKPETLPESLVKLRHLEKLDLGVCKNLTHLPSDIGKLRCLKILHVMCVSKLEMLPESLVELKHLETLDLEGCENLRHLPNDIGKLQCLKILRLDGASKLEILPESLAELGHLETLDLEGCKNLTHLPNDIGRLECLKIIRITFASQLNALPRSLVELRHLETLDLHSCGNLTDFPYDIGKLQHLKILIVPSASKTTTLPQSLVELKQLETLTLRGCRMLTHLSYDIKNFQCLKILSLEGASNLEALPESLVELQHLETLDLGGCRNLTYLPDDIGQLQCLKNLYLKGASRLETLPKSLVELRHLKTLDLGGCENLTHLPHGIKKLQSLNNLRIYGKPYWMELT